MRERPFFHPYFLCVKKKFHAKAQRGNRFTKAVNIIAKAQRKLLINRTFFFAPFASSFAALREKKRSFTKIQVGTQK
jgi:hypothetical protein